MNNPQCTECGKEIKDKPIYVNDDHEVICIDCYDFHMKEEDDDTIEKDDF